MGTGSLTAGVISGLSLSMSGDTVYYITVDKGGASRETKIDTTSPDFSQRTTLFVNEGAGFRTSAWNALAEFTVTEVTAVAARVRVECLGSC